MLCLYTRSCRLSLLYHSCCRRGRIHIRSEQACDDDKTCSTEYFNEIYYAYIVLAELVGHNDDDSRVRDSPETRSERERLI